MPTADAAGALNLSGSNGKVDLVNATDDRIDLIGYGNATLSETNPTAALSNSTAAIRKELTIGQNDRGRDTDNNAADFSVMTPDPRNSASPVTPVTPGSGLGAVTANPEPNAWPAGTEITLNPPTVGASVYADVYRSGGNGSGFQLVTGPIILNEPTRVDAYAAQDGQPDGPVSSFNTIF